MNRPIVTIGIPLYNEALFIRSTLLSALNQSYPNIEILISDNGSTDKSLSVIEDLIASNSKIRVFRHPKNLGPFFNFNFLLVSGHADYFMWLGGHDQLSGNYIEQAMKVFEDKPDAIAVYPFQGTIVQDKLIDSFEQDDFDVTDGSQSEQFLKIIRNCNFGAATHGLYKRDVLRKSFLDINGGDLNLFLKAASFGKFYACSSIIYYLRDLGRKETDEQMNTRYLSYGFRPNWREIHSMYPFQIISELRSLTFHEKLDLLGKARLEMYRFKASSWRNIVFYHLRNFKWKTSFLALMCKLKGI